MVDSTIDRATSTFTLVPRGPFSLDAAIAFLDGFTPAARRPTAMAGHLHLAFVVDGTNQPVGVCVRQVGDHLAGEVFGTADPAVVEAQVARILSLDVDGAGFAAVADRDPVAGRLQARHPGLRPVSFYSPYEAAVWAIISQRIRMSQAGRIKGRMALELGTAVTIHGEVLHAFPAPHRLVTLESFPGLFGRKVEYLRAVAEAALAGRLDAGMLRSLPRETALRELKTLPGIGDFAAEHVLLRGAGDPDALPVTEPRLQRAMARAYSLEADPDAAQMHAIAENWRPYRTWVTFLLRVMRDEDAYEIATGRQD
jgi:DNA-3-methyladenine glycosylase II